MFRSLCRKSKKFSRINSFFSARTFSYPTSITAGCFSGSSVFVAL